MQTLYTEESLIKLLYKECDLFEQIEMEFAIAENDSLASIFQKLKTSYDQLPKVKFSPSRKSIKIVMEYSQSHEIAF